MAKIDGGLRALFRTNLMSFGFHCQSIETGGTGLGVPDLNYCCNGREGWAEFKLTKVWAVDLRVEQVGWLLARHRAGGRVFIGVRRKCAAGPRKAAADELWLIGGESAAEVKEFGLAGNGRVCTLGVWSGGPKRWNWEEIKDILIK